MSRRKCIERHKVSAPEFVKWLEDNVEEGLTCFSFPEAHRKRIRTVNGLERLNREIRRRTRVVTLFPNVASRERLITAVLQGVHEEWITGKQWHSKNWVMKAQRTETLCHWWGLRRKAKRIGRNRAGLLLLWIARRRRGNICRRPRKQFWSCL